MIKLNFTKMHWIWNDFIMVSKIDLDENKIELTTEFIRKICDRHFWIGSDWLIIVWKWKKEKFKFSIYNPDWSEAEMCWNGIRCYMKYIVDKSFTDKKDLKVETLVDVLNLQIEDDIVTVNMWSPKVIKELTYKTKQIWDVFMLKADDKYFKFTPISMWNPHAVIFLKNNELANFELEKYWKLIENNIEIFPKRTNVEFVEILSSIEINMRVWERWAWETLACWTWTCASVVAWILAWYLKKDEFIKVNLSWWILEIKWDWDKNHGAIMKWKAETTFEWVYFVKE